MLKPLPKAAANLTTASSIAVTNGTAAAVGTSGLQNIVVNVGTDKPKEDMKDDQLPIPYYETDDDSTVVIKETSNQRESSLVMNSFSSEAVEASA